MFYSEKTFLNFATGPSLPNLFCGHLEVVQEMRRAKAPKKAYRRLFKEVKQGILNRESQINFSYNGTSRRVHIGKWFRPWDLVPVLREFRPPAGDYGIGIEVEGGFRELEDAQFIISKIANWKYVTVDFEGNGHPAEVTFPPVLYSKFGSQSQACRYLKLLTSNMERVLPHLPNDCIGTHVNVSTGNGIIIQQRVNDMRAMLASLHPDLQAKYFGRSRPYGYTFYNNENNNTRIEYKMFDTVFNWRRLRQYVDIAVKLTDLLCDTVPLTHENLIQALEAGYNKHPITENNNAA